MSYLALFLRAISPGQVLRYYERSYPNVKSVSVLLLSDAVDSNSLRCLLLNAQDVASDTPSNHISSIGHTLSNVFPPRVTLLWRHASVFPEPAQWGFTVWENGEVMETAEHNLPLDPKPSLLSCLPGMKRNLPHPPDIAWALAHGLPIDRVPAAGLRRNIPVIDYATVAQLDQRSLLVENTPRLYRFPL